MTRVFPNPPPPGDDLDVLLGSFFKGEMPAPWPAFRPPEQRQTLLLNGRAVASRRESSPAPASRMLLSRLALAASVALLFLAGLLLGGKLAPMSGPGLPTLTNPGSANPKVRFPTVPTEPAAATPDKAKTPTAPRP